MGKKINYEEVLIQGDSLYKILMKYRRALKHTGFHPYSMDVRAFKFLSDSMPEDTMVMETWRLGKLDYYVRIAINKARREGV